MGGAQQLGNVGMLGQLGNPTILNSMAKKGMGAAGQAMMKQGASQPSYAPAAPAPSAIYSGQQQPISERQKTDEEKIRERRLAYLTRRY
jgi:hypothetical protein